MSQLKDQCSLKIILRIYLLCILLFTPLHYLPLEKRSGSYSNITHFQPIFHSYTPWKHQKISGFLMVSGGTDEKHWLKMSWEWNQTLICSYLFICIHRVVFNSSTFVNQISSRSWYFGQFIINKLIHNLSAGINQVESLQMKCFFKTYLIESW